MNSGTYRLTDELLRAALVRDPAPGLAAAVLDDVVGRARTTRQRRSLTLLGRWLAADAGFGRPVLGRRWTIAAVAATLLLALALALAIVGAFVRRDALPGNGLLVFATKTGELVVRDTAGAEHLRLDLLLPHGLAWSYEGDRLAVWSGVGREWTLKIVDVGTGDVTDLLTVGVGDRFYPGDSLHWSRDGRALLLDAGPTDGFGGIYLIDVATGRRDQLSPPSWHVSGPAWSPDERWMAFVGNADFYSLEENVYIADRLAAGPQRIGAEVGQAASWPGWAPDSKSLIVTMGTDPGPFRLVRLDVPSGAPQVIAERDGYLFGVWSPSGDRLAVVEFSLAPWGGDTATLDLVKPDGTDRERLVDQFCGGMMWSPDGSEILYASGCDGPPQTAGDLGVRSVRRDGSNDRLIWSTPRLNDQDIGFSWQALRP